MADSRTDHCPRCHRLTTFTRGESTGLWFCSRCGRPAPQMIVREEVCHAPVSVAGTERALAYLESAMTAGQTRCKQLQRQVIEVTEYPYGREPEEVTA